MSVCLLYTSNLPVEDIKQMAIASLKDSTMMYFSCDVGKFLNSERGLLDDLPEKQISINHFPSTGFVYPA